jgi:adenosylcobinamide-GDP ribazoletransferase
MPQHEWKDEDMKYMLCFYPCVGVVIGGCVYLWRMICDRFAIGTLCYAMVGTAIPILITGGFHVDGFMDTMDAFHSYQSRERKLEILKDSHIGAFAVIMSGLYGMLYIGAFSEVCDYYLLKNLCAGFVLSRCLNGIGVVSFPPAKNEGMLFAFASNAGKKIVMLSLYLQGVLCILFMLWRTFLAGSVTALAAIGSFIYYYFRCKKELGGITGDTAGYFVLISEGSMVVASAVLSLIL